MPVDYIPEPIKADSSNVTASRVVGTLYTNNNNRPMMIIIAATHTVGIAGSFCLFQLSVTGGSNAWGGWFNTPAIGIVMYSTMVGMVPPNGTYRLTQNAAGGVNTVIQWTEVIL